MLLLLLAALAAPAAGPPAPAAPPSACAGLPTTGPVGQAAAEIVVPAVPTPEREWRCDPDFRLDLHGRLPVCRRPGIVGVAGNPQQQCYAALPIGPVAPVAPRYRPTRSCAVPVLTSIVRLSGANVGWGDVTIAALPADGIRVTTLVAAGPRVPDAENPVVQGCFAFECRLVKLEIDGAAATDIRLRLSRPGLDPVDVPLRLATICPH